MSKRLNQYLVGVGLADSRRKADEIIKQGRVYINGERVTELATQVHETDDITINGKAGKQRDDIYIAYNKPRGLICSHSKQGKSSTIFEDLPKTFASLKIAGRLDKDSRGLLILSSDGDLVNHLTHPSSRKQKTYLVRARLPINDMQLKKINAGIILKDGKSNLSAFRIKPDLLRIVMSEGKNRQIRRTLEAIGVEVVDLERVAIGGLRLDWPESQYRFIKLKQLQ